MNLRPRNKPANIYTRIKILAPPIEKPKKKIERKKKISSSLQFFKQHFEYLIIEKLLSTGDGIISGRLIISHEVRKFLTEKHSVSKKWVDGESILSGLNIVKEIRTKAGTTPVRVNNFEVKFGNNRSRFFFSAKGKSRTDF
jgi:hypothetical protein